MNVGDKLRKYTPDVADWCAKNNAYVVKQNGEYVITANPEPTEEEKQQALMTKFQSSIQAWMDGKAQELGYDNVLSVCSYINTGNPKFDAEGEAFRHWRSAVWAKGYELIDEVLSGQREVPDAPAEVLSLLPELTIVYPDETQPADSDSV